MSSINLKHENEIEDEAQGRTGFFRNIRIAREEYTRFALFGLIFFIIGFIYSFMRILKDMFVMNKQDASSFNFIKIAYILPVSFFVVFYINYLLQNRSVSKIFNMCIIVFTCLFISFGICIVFEDLIMFDSEPIKKSYDDSNVILKSFMYTIAEPISTMIYISAELWGSIILSYLFLSYLNESCSEKQHSRFIPPLFILANVSLLTSAIVTTFMRKIKENLNDDELKIFMGGIFFVEAGLAIIILILKYILENRVMTKPIFIPIQKKIKKSKPKVGFKESLKTMKSSKFLMVMCAISFFCNALYNLVETVFKFGIKAGAEANNINKADHSAKFNNYDQYITSISVIILNFTPFSNLSDTKGWIYVALISPIMALIAITVVFGLGIFNSALENKSFSFFNKLIATGRPLYFIENFSGMLILSAMKIFKYTSFDVTKERISMRIEDRYRPKFKSIYDGIFSKLGKSGGSLYGIFVNGIITDLDPRGSTPLTAVVGSLGVMVWMYGVIYLGGNYNKSLEKNECVDIDLIGDHHEGLEGEEKIVLDEKLKMKSTK
ncbi:hypothetical protein NUSPORA_02537 [Nucleospora cyclopteri]